MHAAAKHEGLLDRLFNSIDRMETERFISFLTEDCGFRFGSAPPVQGKQAVAEAVQAFFASIDGLSHSISRVWRDQSDLACEGEVTYRRHDGSEVIVPFVDVFEFQGDLIAEYKIYIDISPLYGQ